MHSRNAATDNSKSPAHQSQFHLLTRAPASPESSPASGERLPAPGERLAAPGEGGAGRAVTGASIRESSSAVSPGDGSDELGRYTEVRGHMEVTQS